MAANPHERGLAAIFFVSAMIRDLVLEMIHSGKPTPIHYLIGGHCLFLFTGSVWPCKTKFVFQKQRLLQEAHGTQRKDLVNDIYPAQNESEISQYSYMFEFSD